YFNRENDTWTRKGSYLYPDDEYGEGFYEGIIAMDDEGNTLLVGDYFMNEESGGVYVYTRNPNPTNINEHGELIYWERNATLTIPIPNDYAPQELKSGQHFTISGDGKTICIGDGSVYW